VISNGNSSTFLRKEAKGGPGLSTVRAKMKTVDSRGNSLARPGASDTFYFIPVPNVVFPSDELVPSPPGVFSDV